MAGLNILRLLCEPEIRLGRTVGITELMGHPFFKDTDWKNLRNAKPPFIPHLESDSDLTYFDSEPGIFLNVSMFLICRS